MVTENFPLSPGEVIKLREVLAGQVLALRDIEAQAVDLLKAAMS